MTLNISSDNASPRVSSAQNIINYLIIRAKIINNGNARCKNSLTFYIVLPCVYLLKQQNKLHKNCFISACCIQYLHFVCTTSSCIYYWTRQAAYLWEITYIHPTVLSTPYRWHGWRQKHWRPRIQCHRNKQVIDLAYKPIHTSIVSYYFTDQRVKSGSGYLGDNLNWF